MKTQILAIGISEETGKKFSAALKNNSDARKGLINYFNRLLSLGINTVLVILGGSWRFDVITSLMGKNYDIELIMAHNSNWVNGSGTIIRMISKLINNSYIFCYDVLPKLSILKRILYEKNGNICYLAHEKMSIGLGYAYEKNGLVIKVGDIIGHNAYLTGIFKFHSIVHLYARVIDSLFVTYELKDFLYWFNRWVGFKANYISPDVVLLSNLDLEYQKL